MFHLEILMSNNRKYTQEFKKEAVKLVLEQGYMQKEAGMSLEISPKNISTWVRKARVKIDLIPSASLYENELKRLRKENQQLKMEREILKNAAASL
jgi:transposase